MKKQFKLLTLAASAAMMFTACSSDKLEAYAGQPDLNPEAPSNAIQFGTYMGKRNTTRAYDNSYDGGAISNNAWDAAADGTTPLKKTSFGVFAYHSGNQNINSWGNWNASTNQINQTANFMYNEHVTWSTSSPTDQWIYSPVKYWPNGTDAANESSAPSNTATESNAQYLSFFAYAPYTTLQTTAYTGSKPTGLTDAVVTDNAKGIVAMSKNSETADMQIKYMFGAGADETNAIDLLWGLRGQNTYKETDGNNNNVGSLTKSDYNTDLTKQTVDEKVKFLFKHALARVGGSTSSTTAQGTKQICGFKVVVDVDKNSDTPGQGQSNQTSYFNSNFDNEFTYVTIKEVKIRDMYTYSQESGSTIPTTKSDFLTEGWFNIMKGTWSEGRTDYSSPHENGVIYEITANNTQGIDNTSPYALNDKIKEPTTAPTKASNNIDSGTGKWGYGDDYGVDLTAKNLFADENVPGLLLIPGPGGNTLYVTVDYIVRTADLKLDNKFTEVEQVITNKVTLDASALKPNQYYTIVMHLGLTSVKFEAVVSNWQEKSDSEVDENGEETGGSGVNNNSIWLPSNVVSFVGATVSAATTSTQVSLTSGHIATVVGVYSDAACSQSAGGTSAAVNGADNSKVDVTLPANETTKNKTYFVKVRDDNGTAGDTSDDLDVIFAIKQSAHAIDAISATYSPDLVDSKIVAAGATITLPLKVNGVAINLTSSDNVSDIQVTLPAGVVVTKTSTGATIKIPANTTTSNRNYSYTITVNDASINNSVTQASAPITATVDNSAISASSAVTLTVRNEGPTTPVDITAGNYTVGVFTDAGCTAPAAAADYTDTTGTDNKVTFNTAGTYYIKVTSGDSTVTTVAITVS